MYRKKLWKPVIAGTLALAMAFTPVGTTGAVYAAEETEVTTEADTEAEASTEGADTEAEASTEWADTEAEASTEGAGTEAEASTEETDTEAVATTEEAAEEAGTEDKDARIHVLLEEEDTEADENTEMIAEEAVTATGDIKLDAAHFPDANFQKYLSENVDTNKDGSLSAAERDAVTEINVQNARIKSLNGIQYFTQLVMLRCYNNQLTKLDVSKNTQLKYLWCYNNQLTELDVSKNIQLAAVVCWNNQLTKLDVSKNMQMTILYCDNNQLKSLDVSKNAKLMSLHCDNNQLMKLDVSKNVQLEILHCGNNQLTNMDISKNTKLQTFECMYNEYEATLNSKNQLDVSTLPGFQTSKVSNVKGGKLSGKMLTFNSGSKKVTYTYNCGNNKTATFTIVAKRMVRKLTLNKTKATLNPADTLTLKATVTPSNATNKAVTWKSSNTKVATVSSSGKVTAKAAGTATITCTAKDGSGKSATCKITVRKYTNTEAFVARIYTKALGRNPEAAGLKYWTGEINARRRTPVQVAEEFFFAPEFTNKKLNNTEYVKVLYRTFMGREYDQGGLNYWVGRLNKGESRKVILESFAGCQEFKNIVKSFGL
ncbi:MAG: DUF4214 domain-containing protein [Clostridium sp.]|nr:DUF4214 domain-containing protein [Clostridium sp.]